MNNDNRNEEEAVSPVIATILMVAITVVLAGVLYVWASSLAGDSTGGGLDTFQFDDRDAADDLTATGGDDLVHVKMMQGASLSWALLEVSIVVDGGTMNNCVGFKDADAEGLKCIYEYVDDKNWDVSEEITISEGANADLCDGIAGYCEVAITLTLKGVGESGDKVIGMLTATAA
jgi:flagellin-like protein